MAFDVVDDVDPWMWDRSVTELRGSVFHTYAWAASLRELHGGRPVFVRWLDSNGGVTAVAVGSVRVPTLGRLGRAALTVTFDSPPACARGSSASVEPLAAWARREGAIQLTLGSFDGGERSWCSGLRDRHERLEFIARPGSETEVRKRMRRQHNALERAERLGVEVSLGDVSRTLDFAHLYATTVRRLRNTKGVALGEVSTGRFAAAVEVLITSKRGRLYLASLDGELIAGCFFGSVGDSAYYLFNGSTDTALRVGATPSVIFRAVTDLSSQGFAKINLGGVPASARERTSPDHGLYVFKRGLGTQPVLCQGGRIRLRAGRAALFDVARRFRDQVLR